MSPPSPGLRVLMTTDAVGGVWVFSTTLARELCRRGDEVTLVVLGPPPQEHQLAAIRAIAGLEVEITDLALEWMDPEGHDLPRALRHLAVTEQRLRPDVVHLNGYREARGDFAAPVLITAHSCVRSWWRACRAGEPSEARWQRYIANVADGLARADAWVAPTAAFRDTVAALYRPRARGAVILNGTDLGPTCVAKEPFILAAGRLWDEAKNLPALAAVAPELEWPVRVAGPLQSVDGTGPDAQNAVTVESLGPLPRPQVLEQMRRAAVFAAPALYEPFGLTVLEAAAAGCALVISDIASFRELWSGAAVMVDPLNNRALRAAIQAVCRDPYLRDTLRLAAARRAARYRVADMAEAYRATYAALLARTPMLHHRYDLDEVEARA
jgi:glycosyltransferase involved in cell wall biosynthesis